MHHPAEHIDDKDPASPVGCNPLRKVEAAGMHIASDHHRATTNGQQVVAGKIKNNKPMRQTVGHVNMAGIWTPKQLRRFFWSQRETVLAL